MQTLQGAGEGKTANYPKTANPQKNQPIVITNPSIANNLLSNISIDAIEERITTPSDFLGQLFIIEGVAVYASVSANLTKFVLILALTNELVKDLEVRMVFNQLHALYAKMVASPFYSNSDADREAFRNQLLQLYPVSA